MRYTHSVVSVAVALALLGFAAPPTWAVNLTGTWVGEQDCRRYDGTKFFTPFPNDTMTITQNGLDLDIEALVREGVPQLHFHGQVINDDAAPQVKGQASFVECETTESSSYQEIGRATKLDVKSNGTGATFLATSIFSQNFPPVPPDLGTCEWNYQRISTADPGVAACPPSSAPTTTNSIQAPRRP
jgi:hypothetical protein